MLTSAMVVSIAVQIRMWLVIRTYGSEQDHDDFKVRLVDQRLQETKERVKILQEVHDALVAAHEEKMAIWKELRNSRSSSQVTTFENPLEEAGETKARPGADA